MTQRIYCPDCFLRLPSKGGLQAPKRPKVARKGVKTVKATFWVKKKKK